MTQKLCNILIHVIPLMLCDRRAFSPLRVCAALCLLFCIDTYSQTRICECNNGSETIITKKWGKRCNKAFYWVTWVRLLRMSFYSNKSIFSYSAASSPKVSHRNLKLFLLFIYAFLISNWWTNWYFFWSCDSEFFLFLFFLGE